MTPESQHHFSYEIAQAMESRSISIDKLSSLTGISERFIENLLRENLDQLPSQPYVRGYILRIGEVLQIDGKKLWDEYLGKHEVLRRSGKSDVLPQNRFVVRRFPKRILWGVLVIGIVACYGFFRSSSFISGSQLELSNVPESLVVSSSLFRVVGRIDSRDRVSLNGEEVYTDGQGGFEKEVVLQSGYNTLTFVVEKLLGKEYVVTRQVLYRPEEVREVNRQPKAPGVGSDVPAGGAVIPDGL